VRQHQQHPKLVLIKNQLWVDIAIEPVKAVEFIYIPMRIQNTGSIASAALPKATRAKIEIFLPY
jgi:hypothetical protein